MAIGHTPAGSDFWTEGPKVPPLARITAFYLTLNKRLVGSEIGTVVYFDELSTYPFPELLEADEAWHQGHPTVIGWRDRREEVHRSGRWKCRKEWQIRIRPEGKKVKEFY